MGRYSIAVANDIEETMRDLDITLEWIEGCCEEWHLPYITYAAYTDEGKQAGGMSLDINFPDDSLLHLEFDMADILTVVSPY